MKRILTAMLSMVIVLGLSTPAFATDKVEGDTSVSDTIKNIVEESQDTFLNKTKVVLQNVGDSQLIMKDENGALYLELVEQSDMPIGYARAGNTVRSTRGYNVYHKDLFGNESIAAEIRMVVLWVDNGANSYIQDFTPTCTIKNSSYSYKWDNDPNYSYNTDLVCKQVLDIYYGGKRTSYLIEAMLSFIGSTASVPQMNMYIDAFWSGV